MLHHVRVVILNIASTGSVPTTDSTLEESNMEHNLLLRLQPLGQVVDGGGALGAGDLPDSAADPEVLANSISLTRDELSKHSRQPVDDEGVHETGLTYTQNNIICIHVCLDVHTHRGGSSDGSESH